jgi:hypothetical protein
LRARLDRGEVGASDFGVGVGGIGAVEAVGHIAVEREKVSPVMISESSGPPMC